MAPVLLFKVSQWNEGRNCKSKGQLEAHITTTSDLFGNRAGKPRSVHARSSISHPCVLRAFQKKGKKLRSEDLPRAAPVHPRPKAKNPATPKGNILQFL